MPLTPNSNFNNSNFDCALNLSCFESTFLRINGPPFEGSISVFCYNRLYIYYAGARLEFTNIDNKNSTSNKLEWIIKNKILEGNNECPVNLSKINDQYLNCETCHKNFLLNVTQKFIETKKICPHCKQQWKTFIVYTIQCQDPLSI